MGTVGAYGPTEIQKEKVTRSLPPEEGERRPVLGLAGQKYEPLTKRKAVTFQDPPKHRTFSEVLSRRGLR